MSLTYIAWRYLWSRPLVSILTIVGVALGVALVSATLTLRRETEKAFERESALFDLVVGAKGSPLQLVLSSVYHLDMPTGNIPYARYTALRNDGRVTAAYPVGLGDNYKGYRIVGTETHFFDLTENDRPMFRIADGSLFTDDFQAVLGSIVAEETGMTIGEEFFGSHGVMDIAGSEEHEQFPYVVTGILEPTGTASDRAIFVSLRSVWRVHEAEEALHDRLYGDQSDEEPEASEPEEDSEDSGWGFLAGGSAPGTEPLAEGVDDGREVTAVLLRLQSPGMRMWMVQQTNENTEAMAAIPLNEMLRLYQRVLNPLQRALLAVAAVVVIAASLTILTTLYQSAERRRREIAIMRSLGAHAVEILLIVLGEAFLITLLGIGAGFLLGHGAVYMAGDALRGSAGLSVSPFSVDSTELVALIIILVIGIVAGMMPAILAYRRLPAADLARE